MLPLSNFKSFVGAVSCYLWTLLSFAKVGSGFFPLSCLCLPEAIETDKDVKNIPSKNGFQNL